MAWVAARRMSFLWRHPDVPEALKYALFRVTVETVLLYPSATWAFTPTLQKTLSGAYMGLLRYALHVPWDSFIGNESLLQHRPKPMQIVRSRQERLLGSIFAEGAPVLPVQCIFFAHCVVTKEAKRRKGAPVKALLLTDLLAHFLPFAEGKEVELREFVRLHARAWKEAARLLPKT
jgi:hypothetical protein